MGQDPSERFLEWSEKIKAQKLSNLSQGKWCQEQDIRYSTFQYWKSRINRRNRESLKKNEFIEIPEDRPLVEVSLRGIKLAIFKEFDRKGLIHFLSLLKSE